MKRFAIFAAAALVPLIATAAVGADDAKAKAKAVEVRATAECVVEQGPAVVKTLLQTLPGSDEEVRAAERLAKLYTACSGDKFALGISKYSHGLYNGRPEMAAAAAAVALDGRRIDPSRLSGVQAWYASAVSAKGQVRRYDAVSLGMQEFGTCVIKAAPDASVRLVRSRAGSADERQARLAITPVLAGCVVQGKPVSMKIDHLRLMIAEPLYHAIVDGPVAGRRS